MMMKIHDKSLSLSLSLSRDAGDAILTWDTSSFIVGDRVWVNGVRPGRIAYIGTTKFAPGEWAGIVLDDYTGTNDGKVGSTRYFYCPLNRGIFARLWRLTRYPLVPYEYRSSSSLSRSPSPISKYSSSILRSRSVSPSRQVITTTFSRDGSPSRSYSSASSRVNSPLSGKVSFTDTLREYPSKTTVTTTTTYDPAPYDLGPLKIGDKVYVSTSKGILPGRLRFLGHVDFSAGYWAGVELDEPLGKNDGSVAGKR